MTKSPWRFALPVLATLACGWWATTIQWTQDNRSAALLGAILVLNWRGVLDRPSRPPHPQAYLRLQTGAVIAAVAGVAAFALWLAYH